MSSADATASTSGAANAHGAATLPAEVRCSYPSKLCNNHRAVKDNGDLHKLCDFHRKKANVNQQRMQQKRRLIRQQMIERKKRFLDVGAVLPGNIATYFDNNAMDVVAVNGGQPICNLTREEVMMLEVMLFDDEDDENYTPTNPDAQFANFPAGDPQAAAGFGSFPTTDMTL